MIILQKKKKIATERALHLHALPSVRNVTSVSVSAWPVRLRASTVWRSARHEEK
jgi:hypothetical protein